MAIATDKKYVISSSWDKTIRIWNLLEKRQEAVLESKNSWIQNAEVSSDRKYLYLYNKNKILIWNLLDHKEEDLFECNNFPIKILKGTNDNKYIICVYENQIIGLWNTLEKNLMINTTIAISATNYMQ